MKVTVNEQPQQFYLALTKWTAVVGHEIKVGKYRFCAIPLKNHINVSEATTGCKLYNVPISPPIHLMTQTKEDSMDFFYQLGESIKRLINKQQDFDSMLNDMKKVAHDRLGEMPEVKDVEMKI
ncbi:hypothetical protein GLV94_05190 [Virgibacillus halodenitrificans]|uniref:hypothetical protein n=1 Tax=Virgibacillus halodenitrificans TaxID=1482 RepID=UPI00136C3B7A|nr:hypothetical protein [Virgibacillus halodenitrificans]MYL45029.1 hypothetical protein [Virgibacillus halodenitrificans]